MQEKGTELELCQRLAERITILCVEGTLFCSDQQEEEVRHRTGKLKRMLRAPTVSSGG